jgi:regulator of RNase E activity RraA
MTVRRGEVVFADRDGIVILSLDEVDAVCAKAAEIQRTEARLLARMATGQSLISLTNFESHWANRLAAKESALQFRI